MISFATRGQQMSTADKSYPPPFTKMSFFLGFSCARNLIQC